MAQNCTLHEGIFSNYNPPVIIISIILGFAGNAIALWIFCFRIKCWKPNTVYSLNLAIADLLLICSLPFRTGYYVRGKNWIYGDVPCRLNVFLISLNRAGSILFLIVIAIDRYFKVVHPLHKVNKISPRCAVKIAGGVWVVAVAISFHLLIEEHNFKQDDVIYCELFNKKDPLTPTAIWTDTVFIFFKFLLPVSVILFSTSCIIWKLRQMETGMRGKYKRTVKLVIAVAAVFVICFLPTNIAVVAVLVTKLRSPCDCKSYNTAVNIFYNTLFVTYLNSVIDPLIYYFSNSAFKDILEKALLRLNLRSRRPATNQNIEQEQSKAEPSVDQQLSSVTHV
ncbi:hydroxycarboxylic acid receptor 1-like [Pristis pectinata]|uniref:hydroxycarboxylic acid receptor 1-like n=1 Tax=Pristis pectinata TaxID=685728 RepID=UPI00223E36E4|nr:hydroxycarboxylic acid receptor 1-like [Pristis pectinata]